MSETVGRMKALEQPTAADDTVAISPTLHGWLADTTVVVVVLHLLSVVLQDARGQNADTSAMLSGYRYFRIDRDNLVPPELPEVSVRIDEIGKG